MKTNPVSQSQAKRDAFTLTELIVVLAFIALLAAIVVPAYASSMRKSGSMECKNNLRQVGMAIDQYARDHTNTLPGPLWLGVYSLYRRSGTSDTPTTSFMAYHLATYFGLPAPDGTLREVPALRCPASVQARPNLTSSGNLINNPISFISNSLITNVIGGTMPDGSNYPAESANGVWYPFGRPTGAYPPIPPRSLDKFRRPSEQWVMADADQRNVLVSSTYRNYIPANPVHNNRPGGTRQMASRNYLFFDWSVHTIQTSN